MKLINVIYNLKSLKLFAILLIITTFLNLTLFVLYEICDTNKKGRYEMGILKKIGKVLKKAADDVSDEATRLGKRLEKETNRIVKDGEKAVRKTRDALKKAANDVVGEIDHITGINIKPIIKTIAGPAHIIAKIAEGDNISEATTDWVVQSIEGGGEIAGILGSDAAKAAETIIATTQLPVLLISNLAGDSLTIVEGKADIADILGSPLASLIRQAHEVYNEFASPLPMEIKLILSGIVSREILNHAKFIIDANPNNVAGLINKINGSSNQNHAVTIDNIIVFNSPPAKTVAGYALWVHELKHVQQYKDKGVLEFAADYTKNHGELEDEATSAAIVAEVVLAAKLDELG